MRTITARLYDFLLPRAEGDGLVPAAPPVAIRAIFRRFWPFARPYRAWFALTLVFIVLAQAIEAAQIWAFKLVVDDVLVPRDFGPFVWIACAFLGLALLDGAVSFADDYLSTWVGERFVLDLRTEVFSHLHGLSLDFFDRRRLGDVISRLTGDVSTIETFVLSGVADLIGYVVRIAVFAGLLFYLQWDLALVSLLVVPLFWLAARRFSRSIKRASREKRRRSGSISSVAEESLGAAALVQAYNRQSTEVERFRRESLGAFAAEMDSTRLKALFTPLVGLIELLGGLVVIGLGTYELSRGHLTLGGLLAFLSYLTLLYAPIRGLSRLSNLVFSASAGAERLIEFLDEKPSVRERPNATRLPPGAGGLCFDRVSFRYPGAGQDAVVEVSLGIRAGETLALVGPSGAGKTTLAKLAVRFYDPSAGRVTLDGHDLRDLRLRDLRDNIAVLLQETLVFHGTIAENIAYGRPGATPEDIIRASRAADAHDFVMALPDGYETIVGQRGRRLSGGQRQRVAIARAMIRDAPLLILDEPTTGLDAESGRRILEPLRRLMSGRTTIVISHNLATVSDATRIAVLDHGRLTELGTHAELLAAGGGYARLYRLHHADAASPVPARTP